MANLEKNIADALDTLAQANTKMIDCIRQAVRESETDEVYYSVVVDESCGCTEERSISENEDGELYIYDEGGWQIQAVDDLSADTLYSICLKLTK